jgi:hypothetical protein
MRRSAPQHDLAGFAKKPEPTSETRLNQLARKLPLGMWFEPSPSAVARLRAGGDRRERLPCRLDGRVAEAVVAGVHEKILGDQDHQLENGSSATPPGQRAGGEAPLGSHRVRVAGALGCC